MMMNPKVGVEINVILCGYVYVYHNLALELLIQSAISSSTNVDFSISLSASTFKALFPELLYKFIDRGSESSICADGDGFASLTVSLDMLLSRCSCERGITVNVTANIPRYALSFY